MATVAPPPLTLSAPQPNDVEGVFFCQRLCIMASHRAAVHFSTAVHPFLPAPLHPGYDEGVFNRSPPSKSAAVPDWSVPTQSRRPHPAVRWS
jgi:hypothetical protein